MAHLHFMKTAEEWKADTSSHGTAYIHIDDIKQIQLDAIKEGMRRAAEVCVKYKNYGDIHPHINTHQAILTAAEQLIEKDL